MESVLPTLKLSYTLSGVPNRPTLIFLHGFPFNQSMWQAQSLLCQSRFQVLTYDQRGHGQSETGSGQYLFEFYVDDLFGLMDRLHIEKAILCGLSMGGYVALRAIERHPERIAGLILCDTRSEADSDTAKLNRAADLRLIQESGVPAFATRFLQKTLTPSTILNRYDIVHRVHEMMESCPVVGIQGTLIALATRTDTTPGLSSINVPTLILVGEMDLITPPNAAEAMHSRIRDSQLVIIPEAAHLSNLENPAIFNTSLIHFLDSF